MYKELLTRKRTHVHEIYIYLPE